MKKSLQEFKEFALQGSVVDMAIGVVIGAAFKAIVDSLVSDIISPVIGLLAGQDLSYLTFEVLGVEILYGSFISAVINFLLVAFALFVVVKAINTAKKLRKTEEKPAAPTEKECPYCKNKIAYSATRCGFCTSKLEEIPVLEEQSVK